MPAQLSETSIPVGIQAGELRDGEIAVILSSPHRHHIGKIVMRYKEDLISIGEDCGKAWSQFFPTSSSEIRVRVLERGEQIVIT